MKRLSRTVGGRFPFFNDYFTMNEQFGVIFDMDGVLIDTYHAHFKSWQLMTADFGVTMTESQFAQTFGRTSREVIASLWGDRHFNADEIAALDREKEAVFRQIIAADFPLMRGAIELIESLHDQGFRLAIGSSAPPENVEVVLDKLGQRSAFSAVVTGADVKRGKPDPQVFLTAAARMHTPPQRCAVIEDAVLGIQAARAAETAVVGVASTGHTRQSLAAADLVVDTLGELTPEVIARVILNHLERTD